MRWEQPVKAVKEGQMSIRHAASSYGVPKSTLERHINGKVVKPGTLGGKQPVLDKIFENQLVVHVLEMQSRFFGITPSDLKRLAFQLAMRNNIIHPFSKTKEMAGQAWLTSFLLRHPEISLRKPEPTSLTRAVGFNKPQVTRFFNILKTELENSVFKPHNIWNADESGLTCVHRPGKILAAK